MVEEEDQRKQMMKDLEKKIENFMIKGTSNKKINKKVEDIYAKKIFNKVSSVTSRITDAVPFSLHDTFYVLGLANKIVKFTGHGKKVTDIADKILKINGIPEKYGKISQFILNNRVQLADKMNLTLEEPKKDQLRSDIKTLTRKISKIHKHIDRNLDMDVYNDLANMLIDNKFKEIEGYDFRNPKKVKRTFRFTNRYGLGVYDLIHNEVNMPKEDMNMLSPFVLLHEKAHSKGYTREYEANFMAYLCCKGSKHPTFEYSAELTRLIYTMNMLHTPDRYEGSHAIARKKQLEHIDSLKLPDEVVNDIQKRYEYTIVGQKINEHTQGKSIAKLVDKYRARGDRDLNNKYIKYFLGMAADYDRKN